MKKIFSICAMFSVILFGACTDVDTAGETPEVPGTPEEPVVAPEIPVVPAGFDWSTETGVNLTLESGVTTNVSVYSEEDCQDNSLLLEDVLLESDVARTFRMAVPAGAEKLYVKYPAASGADDVVALAVNGADVNYKFPVDAVKSRYEKVPDYQYYYNSGVIMVEDMWPDFAASDADFNDLVVEYDLKTVECTSPSLLPAHGYKEGVIVTLDIRGVGSGRTRKAGLQLDFDTSILQPEHIEKIVYEKAGQGVMTEIRDNRFTIDVDLTQPDKVLILFDGLDNLVQGKHYQTAEGDIEVGKPMIRAYVKLSGVPDRSKLTGEASRAQAEAFRDVVSYPEKHDFFMVLKSAYGSAEIHQKGFAPSYRYKNYETDSKGLMSSVPYCSKDNDVWVLRLPVGTPHVYDRVSIFSAYPDLKEWIESNGQRKRGWYKNYDHSLVPRYW
ncbi:DUF4842 domain-containing protein [Alistipes sp.]|jgi:LruC domain-containing protein|uniref:DUF4842 domain-containing protein n=1 Tax=unclassified Alistipes TaxID=2608932 RepID=UPI001D5019C1|nr:DUF4842 domain-containing protein [Alistipes shahii]